MITIAEKIKKKIEIGGAFRLNKNVFTGKVYNWSDKEGFDTIYECIDGSYIRLFVRINVKNRYDLIAEYFKDKKQFEATCKDYGKQIVEQE